ncbi:Na(+)/H(+) antiporter subunit C [Salinibacterium sp. SWN1162]|uniref:Na(+)/H(+) antiporter subunit C n=1 Tax=Salinibacterium sp. SWN1162 TaxID=2792053 RepID=UPI0018CD20A4|nr:Na(+)/H(+) antiporter subunit C [Salinibacterium sp. SWN1162]MBH0008564.1 Na(+)/H(+) antiporter subunit C [Salinibacterium sp. SWN1162]
MNASLTLVVIMVVLYSVGVYLLLERSMTRVLLGFLLVGNATNLLILIMSGPSGAAAFFGEDAATADPLPQAFILTAIVITFGVSAFLLALIYRSWRLANADVVYDDTEDLAMGRRRSSVTNDRDVAADDTEFGTRAAAAISTAVDLREQEQREEQESLAAERRQQEIDKKEADA